MKKLVVNNKVYWYSEDQTELGENFGFTQPYVAKCLKEGAPKATDHGFCTADWYQWLKNKSKDKDKDSTPLKQATLKLKQEKAKLAKLERKVMEGSLVDAKQYKEAEICRHAELAQEFKTLPSRVSGRAANKSAAEVQEIVFGEVKRILKYFENLCTIGRTKAEEIYNGTGDRNTGKGKVGRPKKIEKASKKVKV
jgi:hypothetical protein